MNNEMGIFDGTNSGGTVTKCIYVLTNESFQNMIMVGHTDNLSNLMRIANNGISTPFPFKVYCTYAVDKVFSDEDLQVRLGIGKNCVSKNFYRLDPEIVFKKLENMAILTNTMERLAKGEVFEKYPDTKVVDVNKITLKPKTDYVWYACYGSNLSSTRFQHYLNECEDKTEVQATIWKQYKGELFFGGKTTNTWGEGGTAFYRRNGDGKVVMKLYKITTEQFAFVKRKEGRRYQNQIVLGEEGGLMVYTLTCFSDVDMQSNDYDETPPSFRYCNTIIEGLTADGYMQESEAVKYTNKWY